MLRFTSQSSHQFYTRLFLQLSLSVLLLLISIPSFGAELSIEYEMIARSGVTPVPGGNGGTFIGFGGVAAIDDEGNVAFSGAGGGQAGVYTYIGAGLQMVADYDTLIPGGGGATFAGFIGAESLDIDGGRVAFKAINQFNDQGLYSNVGQASPADLVEIAVIDGVEWAAGGYPWVDGDVVAMTGERLIPSLHDTILLWDGPSQDMDFIDPGAGCNLAGSAQASISGAEAIFARVNPDVYEMGISSGGGYETLAVAGVTPMPGLGGVLFSGFSQHPVIDRGGLDVAFMSQGGDGTRAVIKQVDGGALQNVADTTMEMPGSGGVEFGSINESGVALANGQVVFNGNLFFFEGIYTDIGGELSVIVDNEENALIELDGQLEEIIDLNLGSRSFVHTPQGYMVVFKANLVSGDSAIIRATISDAPGTGNDTFTVYKDFSDNSSASVSVSLSCSSGTVTNNPQLASEASAAQFNISGAVPGTSCTAIESVPSGYTADQSDCQNGDPLNGSCTIVNNLVENDAESFWVFKDFSDDNSASVSVTLSCSRGTVTNNPQLASEAAPAEFSITGSNPSATCTATENSVPSGYTADQSECQDVPLRAVGGCEIFNTAVGPLDDMLFKGGFEG